MTTIARLAGAALIALTLILGSLTLAAGTAGAEELPGTVAIDVEHASDETVQQLLDAGFYGDPNDGAERLYAPAVVDVENAPEWIVETLLDNGYVGDPNDQAERLYQTAGLARI